MNPTRAPCPHCPNTGKLFSVPHGLRVHIGRMHRSISTPNSLSPTSVIPVHASIATAGSEATKALIQRDFLSFKKQIRVLRHVPKGARYLAAGKLTEVIDSCLQSNGVEDWFVLLTFAFTSLQTPDRAVKGSLTSKVKENVQSGSLGSFTESSPLRSQSIYKSVAAKVYEGDLRGASRLLTSDCTFAPSNANTLDRLREIHPRPSRSVNVPLASDSSDPCLTVQAEEVAVALHSFPRGSASGLDGLRPEHLQELTSPSAGDNGPRLLEALTRLCNFLLRGRLNPEICPFLYGGSLCALQKKDGGIRPIAVGNILRRLVAKLCCRAVKNDMSAYLQPHQMGFGCPLGCEAAIHATRTFAMRENSDDVVIKLDIRNAFNTVERDVILTEVRGLIPAIYPFIHQCYATQSNLSFNGSLIGSCTGAQQGDPLGPLIFSLAIHKVITSLDAPLNIWYLDDGTLGGSPDTLEGDIRTLFPALKDLGLEVNTAKCEFFPCSSAAESSIEKFQSLIPGLKVVNKSTLSLLGAPIFFEGVQDCLLQKIITLSSLSVHFKQLPAHVSLTLLRSCLALPKLVYVVRTAPTWKLPDEVSRFDNTIKHILEATLNVQFGEAQWRQASLPIRYGGLGMRRLQEAGPVAFLASSHGTADLVTRILSCDGDSFRVPYAEDALGVWSALCPGASPPEKPSRQRNWDDPLCNRLLSELKGVSTGTDLARLNAASKAESGAWLHALPSPHMGTLLDDDSLRVAVALRLGCPVCEPHVCICGAKVEANGLHGLSCTRCAGRRPRHHAINDILKRALLLGEVPCVLEPPGLSRSDGKRPDGLTLVPWQRGRCLVWDATCVCTFASCHLPATQRTAGAGAESAARNKRNKYAFLESAYDFLPFSVETAGPWGSEAKKFVSDLGRRLTQRGRDPRSGWFLTQNISLAIQRGNAAGVFGTFGQGPRRGACD